MTTKLKQRGVDKGGRRKHRKLPRKWREGHEIGEEYAFSATWGAWNLAPPIISKNFTFGTFVSATPCTSIINLYQTMFFYFHFQPLQLRFFICFENMKNRGWVYITINCNNYRPISLCAFSMGVTCPRQVPLTFLIRYKSVDRILCRHAND